MKSNSGGKAVRYNKWGYIFLIPFIVVFVIFQLVPLVNTIYNSFFENYMSGLTQVGPTFVGLDNYKALFSGGDIWTYFKNTMVLWIMCFIPQIFLSLLLGAWFSDVRLKLKGSRFFKTVIYLPNLIMASAFSMFFLLFCDFFLSFFLSLSFFFPEDFSLSLSFSLSFAFTETFLSASASG